MSESTLADNAEKYQRQGQCIASRIDPRSSVPACRHRRLAGARLALLYLVQCSECYFSAPPITSFPLLKIYANTFLKASSVLSSRAAQIKIPPSAVM